MQERHVTVGEETYPLPDPFFVLATQNPIEQEGTYPLPEAQLDRFMFMIMVNYPTAEEEIRIMKQVTSTYEANLEMALTGEDILRLQDIVRRVPVADHVFQYARDLARASRPAEAETPDFINEMVNWGAGPRAGIYMILTGKARATMPRQKNLPSRRRNLSGRPSPPRARPVGQCRRTSPDSLSRPSMRAPSRSPRPPKHYPNWGGSSPHRRQKILPPLPMIRVRTNSWPKPMTPHSRQHRISQADLREGELIELGISADDWARLPGRLQNQVLQAARTSGPEEYQILIKRYFRALAKKASEPRRAGADRKEETK